MAGTDVYLGPPGGPVKLPGNIAPVEAPLVLPLVVQELADGGVVVNRMGRARRRYAIPYAGLTADELGILERLILIGGVLVLDDPNRRNRLTANQASGSDTGLTTDGIITRTQGTVTRSTAQARQGTGSFAWATGSALGSTGRGLVLANSNTVPDATWHPVRATGIYTCSGYLRTSAAVSMQAVIEWRDAAGSAVGSPAAGTGVAIGTGDFNSRPAVTGTAPAGAAYGLAVFLNTTTTGAAVTVYLDNPQVEEAGAASAYVIGTGIPRIAVVGVSASSPLLGYTSPALDLQEV